MGDMIWNILLIFIAVGAVGYFIMLYNGLIRVKNNVDKAWSNIDVLLKQRHDELPKLIKTCEAYMKYEKDTLSEIMELRASAYGEKGIAKRAEKEGFLTAALGKLFAISENYPDLKANSNFQNLQRRVTDIENMIADRREFYNESVNNYNIRIEQLPDNFVAGFMHLSLRELFKVTAAERRDIPFNIKTP